MATRFVSKNSNYMVVLKPGVEGSRALGTHSIPGVYVQFQAGVVDVKEEDHIKLMREHSSFGTDFIEVGEDQMDPYIQDRTEIEPDHIQADMKYGRPENRKMTSKNVKLSPQVKKIIETEAIKMIPELLEKNPDILKSILSNLSSEEEKVDAEEKSEDEEKPDVETPEVKETKKETKPAPKTKK